ncbi:MAG: ligase-associated DNA damage response endonuclease PdeM [Oculatellaceae cyanobacterium bins.114]|nr:ligase-associated DNA damage response endonuclease PdeM [Oculatellaceae cyanobacterium bins.114]
MELSICNFDLKLLPEKAIYIKQFNSLLVSDIHLGKSETFQQAGIPIPNSINAQTLDRLQKLCSQLQPDHLFILGDLFHSRFALVDEVLDSWLNFLNGVKIGVTLIIGNHDRYLTQQLDTLSIHYSIHKIQIDDLILSHEPSPQTDCLNICGHIHPCLKIKTKLDSLRLPCFYFNKTQNLLILPSFGEFTGGYEMELTSNSTAYVIAEDAIVPFQG